MSRDGGEVNMEKELTLEERVKSLSSIIKEAIFNLRKLHPDLDAEDIYSYQHETVTVEDLFFQDGMDRDFLESRFELVNLKIREANLITTTSFKDSNKALEYLNANANKILSIYIGVAKSCAAMLLYLEKDGSTYKNIIQTVKDEVSEYGSNEA